MALGRGIFKRLELILKDHQPTGRLANIPVSRERRLNPPRHRRLSEIQSSLTRRGKNHAHLGLKPTAKFRRRYAACERPRDVQWIVKLLNSMSPQARTCR